ncbi:MAG: hypothetical protein V3U03_17475 [Myxococcota bacterium]
MTTPRPFSPDNRSEKFILRLRPDELKQITQESERVAEAEGGSPNRSAIIRRALDFYFDSAAQAIDEQYQAGRRTFPGGGLSGGRPGLRRRKRKTSR